MDKENVSLIDSEDSLLLEIETLKIFAFKNSKIDLVAAKELNEATDYYTKIVGVENYNNCEMRELKDWHYNYCINIDVTDLTSGEEVIQDIPLIWAVERHYKKEYTGPEIIERTCKEEHDIILGIEDVFKF